MCGHADASTDLHVAVYVEDQRVRATGRNADGPRQALDPPRGVHDALGALADAELAEGIGATRKDRSEFGEEEGVVRACRHPRYRVVRCGPLRAHGYALAKDTTVRVGVG